MIQMPWTPNELYGRFLLEEIVRGGNFGKHDDTYALTKDASHAIRMMQKACYNLSFWKFFPKECVYGQQWIISIVSLTDTKSYKNE